MEGMIQMKYQVSSFNTKKTLAMSFKKLIRKKPLSKITISEIISDCGLNRNTFYTILLPNRPMVDRLVGVKGQALGNLLSITAICLDLLGRAHHRRWRENHAFDFVLC